MHVICHSCGGIDIGIAMDPIEGGMSQAYAEHRIWHMLNGETAQTEYVDVDVQVGEEPIYEEKEVLSTILKKNDFSTRKQIEKTTNLLMLATGSSYNACLAAKPALESYGELTVDIQEPFHFAHYGKLSPSIDTVIAVSQSGKSASTVEAVKMIQKQEIPIIAVTNDVQSPLALEATQIIDLGAGIETVGFVTKGYSATVLQLLLLGLGIGISKIISAKK